MFKSDGSFLQNTISEVTKSPYVHSALAVDSKTLIEANGFIKTREFPLSSETGFDVYRIEGLTGDQKSKIVNYAKSKIGTKYDYEKIVGLLIRFEIFPTFKGFNEAGHFICSGLLDEAFLDGGVQRKNQNFENDLAPCELLEYYKLKKVIEQ
jgi:uncharacterized protein YycO